MGSFISFLPIIAVLAPSALVFMLVAAGVGQGTASRRQLGRRIAAVRRVPGAVHRSEANLRAFSRRRGAIRGMPRMIAPMLDISGRIEHLHARLAQAGLHVAVVPFIAAALSAGAVTAFSMLFLVGLSLGSSLLSGLVAAVWLPKLFLAQRIGARRAAFINRFPDALDLIVRSVKSGLPVVEAVRMIGEEIGGPVGEVFREVAGHVAIGMPFDEALVAASRRLDLQEFKFFVISLSIQQQTGGNIAEILQGLSNLLRRRHQLKMKIKAMSSEARASAMIIGSLPFFMMIIIYFVNREYVMILFTTDRGLMLLCIGAASMLTGIAVIAKMVRFEI